jgi:thioredoxin-related protein
LNSSLHAGNRGGRGVLMVEGQPICNYCQSDIKKMGQALDLDELEIHHLDTGEVTTLSRSDMRNVPDGGAKLKDRLPNSCT